MILENFDSMIDKLKGQSDRRRVALAAAEDLESIKAVIKAEEDGLVEPILVGNEKEINEIFSKLNIEKDYPIYNEIDPKEAAHKAVSLIREGKADFLMKGKIDTAGILGAVVKKDTGLNIGKVMSHFVMIEVPNYHKLLVTTDGGMIMYPTLEQKVAITNNAVDTLLNLGYEKPKVGILTAIEKVNENMPETVEARKIMELNQEGKIKNCIVEGPISYDIAMNKEISDIKGFESPVAGDVDILIMPDINTGNVLGKSLIYSADSKMAGIIVGAKAPIVLTSRGSSAEERYLSIVLAALSVS